MRVDSNYIPVMPVNNNVILIRLMEKQIEEFRKLAEPMKGSIIDKLT